MNFGTGQEHMHESYISNNVLIKKEYIPALWMSKKMEGLTIMHYGRTRSSNPPIHKRGMIWKANKLLYHSLLLENNIWKYINISNLRSMTIQFAIKRGQGYAFIKKSFRTKDQTWTASTLPNAKMSDNLERWTH